VKLAIVYDNTTMDPALSAAWGFSCLVGDELLFDTGADAPRLLSNMREMGIDVGKIRTVVLSHIHGDHVGGLAGILAVNKRTTVYVPRSFPANFKSQVKDNAHLVEVRSSTEIAEGIYTTGQMGKAVREQSLALVTQKGLVIVTGCAHPGIVNIITKAKEVAGQQVHLAIGGFHLGGVSHAGIKGIVEDFRKLGVQQVAPCHCSGDLAQRSFQEVYGGDYISVGVGTRLEID